MTTNIALQEIHDTLPDKRPVEVGVVTDWQAMWRQRGDRLMRLAYELEEMTRQRDVLAQRCAEQANHIAGLISLQADEAAEAEGQPIAEAIAAMQRGGVR